MKTTIKWKRFVLGLIVGASVSAQILSMIHYYNGPNGLTLKTLPYTPLLALTYLIFMLPTAFLVGVPIAKILSDRGWFKGWVVITIGTLSGATWAIPTIGYKPPSYDLVAFFSLGGFVASMVFWLVYAGANNSHQPTPKTGAAVLKR